MDAVGPEWVGVGPVVDLRHDVDVLIGASLFGVVEVVDAAIVKIVIAGRPNQDSPFALFAGCGEI